MRSGRGKAAPIFERRRFWPPVLWLLTLAFGVSLGCALRSPELITAVVLAAFLGLNETSRWAYRTNLLICTVSVIVGTVAGVFTWFQTAFIFALLFVICGYMLYFRDSARRLLPYFEEFSSDISPGKNLIETTTLAVDIVGEMSGGEAVFIAVAAADGGLYLPDYHDDKRMDLKRNGGAVWKVFATGRSYMTNKVEPSRDLPLDMEARALMSVPLLLRGEKLGVLQVESDQSNAFTDYDLSKLEILAFIISQAIFLFVASPRTDDMNITDRGESGHKGAKRTRRRTSFYDSAQTKLDLEPQEE